MVSVFTNPVGTRSSNDDRHLVFVSNRGPLEHYFDECGEIKARKAGGGVAVALAAAAPTQRLTWIAGACSPADRQIARSIKRLPLGSRASLRLVEVPEQAALPYYNSFCNPILWFIQHSLGEELQARDLQTEVRDSWLTGYLPVNRLFADAVIAEIDRLANRARVMLHDYHLYIAPRLIRRARPNAVLQQFIHIPWPEPSQWDVLPAWVVTEICRGLLANDSLAFQTDASAANFIATCEALLEQEPSFSATASRINYEGRTVHIWSNPISVDPLELSELGRSAKVAHYRPEVDALTREMTIVRVDRLDPSKNVLRGFEAYELLLRRRPDLRERVSFLAFLVPSRPGIPEYDSYAQRVLALIESINWRFSTDTWSPITLLHEQNREHALACLAVYDVLLVNSVADGMNLVSKEGPLVNERDGVLCLSTSAGSYEQLRKGVIAVDPLDVEKTSQGLEMALELCPEVRQTMRALNQSEIEAHQLTDWLRHLVQDMELTAWRKERRLGNT